MTVMHMTKNVGKPYEGKLHVRFDEGELKVKQRPAKESLLEISSLLYREPRETLKFLLTHIRNRHSTDTGTHSDDC